MDTEANPVDQEMLINKPAIDDVIAGIIAHSKLDIFSSNRKDLHTFFRNLKADPEFDELLMDVVFSKGADLFQFSRTLENTLVRLQLGGLIYAKNPEYNKYGMTPEARAKTLEKAKKRFSVPQMKTLEKAGRSFSKKFSGHTPTA